MTPDTEALIALPRQRVFFQTDEQGRIIMCNDLMSDFLDCEEASIHGAWFPDLAEAGETEGAAQLLAGALEGRPDTGYVAFSTASGRKLAQVTLVPQFQNGQPSGTFGFIHDATDRLEKTRRLIESERQYKELYERYQFVSQATSDVLWDWNLESNEIYINQSFTRLLGFELPAQHVSGLWRDNIHPDDRERVLRKQMAAVRDPEVFLWEDSYRFFHADGSVLYLQDRAVIIRDPSGRTLRMIGAVHDITERTENEEAIRLSEEKYRLLFYQSPEPKWIFRREDLRFVEVNDAAIDHYGYSRKEFLSMTVIDLQPPPERDRVRSFLYGDFMPAGRMQNISQHLTKDGDIIAVELTTHGIYLDNGYHVLVNANDVTEKLELERKVLEEKITAQKEIARTIINTQEKERSEIGKELHDNVNQMLTTAKLYIENIGYYPAQQADYILKSAGLLQRAITEIRNLSKALVTPVLYDIGLRATLDELIEQYRALHLFTVRFSFEAQVARIENGLQLTIYRILQEQLNNIVKHAAASKVSIEVEERGDRLRICINDNGVGFDPQQKRGGLGLHNMKNRIEVFKGDMVVTSADNKGCSICISFPIS